MSKECQEFNEVQSFKAGRKESQNNVHEAAKRVHALQINQKC